MALRWDGLCTRWQTSKLARPAAGPSQWRLWQVTLIITINILAVGLHTQVAPLEGPRTAVSDQLLSTKVLTVLWQIRQDIVLLACVYAAPA